MLASSSSSSNFPPKNREDELFMTSEEISVIFQRNCRHLLRLPSSLTPNGRSKRHASKFSSDAHQEEVEQNGARFLPSSTSPQASTSLLTVGRLQWDELWANVEDESVRSSIALFVDEMCKIVQSKIGKIRSEHYRTLLAESQNLVKSCKERLTTEATMIYQCLPCYDISTIWAPDSCSSVQNCVNIDGSDSDEDGMPIRKRAKVDGDLTPFRARNTTQIKFLLSQGATINIGRGRKIVEKPRWEKHAPISKLPIQGASEPCPQSTAVIHLKVSQWIDDETSLTHIPWFGDDDNDDILSEVFNVEQWRKRVQNGPDYKIEKEDELIDQVMCLVRHWVRHEVTTAGGMGYYEQDELQESKMETIVSYLRKHVSIALGKELERVTTRDEILMDKLVRNDNQNEVTADPDNIDGFPKNYKKLNDSFLSLFCRRCFAFDCNLHGNPPIKPETLEFHTRLALEKEVDGSWNRFVPLPGTELESFFDLVTFETLSNQGGNTTDVTLSNATTQLNPRQKLLLERAYLIFQGDATKISHLLQISLKSTLENIVRQGLKQEEFRKPITSTNLANGVKCKKVHHQSLSQYNRHLLKRAYDAEIRPTFNPCVHGFEPCSESNCSCIQSAFFCTKHCALGPTSKNYFRGCSCKTGGCRTNACSCFALGRECDPDLCHSCGTCSDPPNGPASTQMCRNDNIGMRRHAHLLVGKSTIKEAGWGIFTKHLLKKGDYIHEYVGETISQDEAERRGIIYDKINRSFLFNLCSDSVIDATRKGNKTRFINHNSDPNSVPRIVWVNGDARVGLFALRDIEAQTEVFFDYRYDEKMDNDLIFKAGHTTAWLRKVSDKK